MKGIDEIKEGIMRGYYRLDVMLELAESSKNEVIRRAAAETRLANRQMKDKSMQFVDIVVEERRKNGGKDILG